mmetsp:Transcript_22889/g.42728  ORF Transcript_22889/g.42728 Transcript_22889/m.42728 type:complete len:321 (-) Transcript_22889:151-1113(-)
MKMFSLAPLMLWLVAGVEASSDLPMLDMSDFSWAENLLITHTGLHMFVSDNTRGELYRISLSEDGGHYDRSVHVSGDEFAKFGGLAQSADGQTVYAGVTMADGSAAIITTPVSATGSEYSVFYQTTYQPNGLQIDLAHNVLYYTDTASGSLMAVNFATPAAKSETLVESVKFANGCWLDATNDLLYVGQLVSKDVTVFNTSTAEAVMVKQYAGMSSLSMSDMLDDLTLYSTSSPASLGSTMLLGADYQGHTIQQFTLDGQQVQQVPVSPEVLSEGALAQITSVRWGVAPSFDPDSIYVSEGGGMTKRDKSRRVFQVKMKD